LTFTGSVCPGLTKVPFAGEIMRRNGLLGCWAGAMPTVAASMATRVRRATNWVGCSTRFPKPKTPPLRQDPEIKEEAVDGFVRRD